MSRFYDLLKTAQHSRSFELAVPAAEQVSHTISLPDIDLPQVVVPVGTADVDSVSTHAQSPGVNFIGDAEKGKCSFKTARAAFPPKLPVISNACIGPVVEYYRRLRTKILQEREARPFRSVVVTSPAPQEGKSITTLNLALSIAMVPSLRVVVIDGDLRRGSLGSWLGADEHLGFTNLIDDSARVSDVLHKLDDPGLYFVGRGNSNEQPGELLQSGRLPAVCRWFAEEFDVVVIDSAPINVVADTQLLLPHFDSVLLVARAFMTRKKDFDKAFQDIQHYRVLGTVLNGSTRPRHYRRGYGAYDGY